MNKQPIPTRFAVFVALAVFAVALTEVFFPDLTWWWRFFRYSWLHTFD